MHIHFDFTKWMITLIQIFIWPQLILGQGSHLGQNQIFTFKLLFLLQIGPHLYGLNLL